MRGRVKILLIGTALAVAAAVPAIARAGGDQTAPQPNVPAVDADIDTGSTGSTGDNRDDEITETDRDEPSSDADSPEDTNETDIPITGPDLDRASEVAINHLGGGTVTETEIEDEESYYEVEVTLDDGSQVDVQLDENFNVVGTEKDDSGFDD